MNSKSQYALSRETHSAITGLRNDGERLAPGHSYEGSVDKTRLERPGRSKNSEIEASLGRRAGKRGGSGMGGSNSMQMKSLQEKQKDKSVDYLQERRNKRRDGTSASMQWQNDIKDEKLSMREKYERVSEKVRKLEGEAQRKEQLLIVQQKIHDVEETNEVTDMLVDAIKAKLAILEGI